MKLPPLTHLLIDQSKDLIWIINLDFQLIYANKAYLRTMKEMTGTEKKLNESVLVEGFGEGYIEKWKTYYNRALKGEFFEIEEHYYHPESKEIQYGQVTFEPLIGDDNKFFAVACQSKDVTSIVKQKSEASQLIDASLDVFCTIDEKGNFVYVSAGALTHWGYMPEEMRGKPYVNFILEEDVPKTNEVAANILIGAEVKSFVNRYKKKDGSIAYNLWSARWDSNAKLMYCVARDGKDKIEQEEKIQQSEQRFKALVQDGYELMTITDLEGNYLYVSPSSTAITGFTPDEFMGMNGFDFIHPEDAERVLDSVKKLATQNRVVLEPFRTRHKNNQWRWAETIFTNMLDNPAVLGIVANTRDVTERVNALKQMEENELFNRTVLESSPDCLKVLDTEGRLQYMNFNGLCQMEIDDFSTVKHKSWWTLWGSENEAIVKAAVDKALKGESAQFTALCATAKGNLKWWDVMVSPVGKPGESIKQIISVSRDITEQKKEEQRLKLLESVVKNTNDAILITEAEPFDEPGPKIIFVNEAFTKLTGYTAEEIIGKTPRILQGPNSDKEALAELGRKMRNWEPCELTTINYKKSGEEFWIIFSLTPVADEKGWYTHWIAIERDVTEQKIKELENELLARISINFNSENNYIIAINELCKTISEFGKFDWVEVWTSNLEKNQIQLFSHYLADPNDEKFYDDSNKHITFKIAEGLAGKVYSEGAQLLWDDIENNKDFVRRDAAKKIGLKAVLGIPLIFNNEVVGILKIGIKQFSNYLKKYVLIFQRLERFIGAEINRKKLENDLSHLFDAIPDIICLMDFTGRFLKINKAGCGLLGYTEEEILYHNFNEFLHPDDKADFNTELTLKEMGATTHEFENRFITKSAEIIALSWFCNSSFAEGLIYATAKNITKEKKLRELNRVTRSLAKIGSWELNLINQQLFWSDEVHQLHETDAMSFVPKIDEAINFYREDFREIVQTSIGKSITEGLPFDFEAVIVTANKKELWVRAIGNAEFVSGQCARIFGSFQNIHDRRVAEIRLQSLADNLPGVVYQYRIYTDGTDSLKYVTKGSQHVWGFTAEEVMQNNQLVWDRIILGGEFDKVKKSISDSINTKTKWTTRWKYVMPSGEIKTHLGYGSPNFLADGTILFHSVILDITLEAKNEELLEQVSQLAKIGSWEADLRDNKHYWSPTLHSIFETDPNQFVPDSNNAHTFYREDFHPIIQLNIEQSIEKGTLIDYEAVIVTLNNKEKWVKVLGNAEIINGKCVKLFGSLQDITERKKAEEELAYSENKFRSLIENSSDMLTLITADGRMEYISPSVEKTFGYTNEENKTRKAMDVVHPDDAVLAAKTIENAFKTPGVPFASTIRNRKKDGTYIWVEGTVTNMLHVHGVNAIVANIRDITERKKAEEQKALFSNIVNSSYDAILSCSLESVIYSWNTGAEKMFGFTSTEIIGKKVYEIIPPYLNHEEVEIIEKIKCGEFIRYYETERQRKNGERIFVSITVSPIKDSEENIVGISKILRDITESKKVKEELIDLNKTLNVHAAELKRSNEELEQFAFVASHDLQEPLRMISSFMDLLQRKYEDQLDEKGHQYIHFAVDGAKRMKQIILDLLEYSRAGKSTDGKEDVDLNEVLSEFKQLRRKLILEKTASITSVALPKLNTYKVSITQILHCLLDNALKYSVQGTPPKVQIKAVENENEWEFSIKDNGIGIAPEFYDKIFVIFQRLHNKNEYAGTGIGLSIAKRHIEFLGGRIWLKSIPGEGTTFYFTISKIK
ncbi:MAG: PAS domain S-box protein [Bacteroidetes bacterium]|nr:PAS domain S-box protein [Bacteroidota bacterium]